MSQIFCEDISEITFYECLHGAVVQVKSLGEGARRGKPILSKCKTSGKSGKRVKGSETEDNTFSSGKNPL